jgi:hypothetical protein
MRPDGIRKEKPQGQDHMQRGKNLAYISLLTLTQYPFVLDAQEPHISAPVSQGTVTKRPEHPITEEQIRNYFSICHVENVSRALTHEKMEAQRKQLPEWHPQSVWDEIENAIDKIDQPSVGLPVYQKYLSESDARMLIELFATPEGQQLVERFLENTLQAQHAGLSPMQARDQAAAYVPREENDRVLRLYNRMTPEQRRGAELFAQSSDYKRIQAVLKQIAVEYQQATIDKQTELAKAIVLKHQAEMSEAKSAYEANHNSESHPKPPQ